jgi:hypothetical protein
VLILFDPTRQTIHTMAVSSVVWVWPKLDDPSGITWLCGEPGKFGVASPPGGGRPMLVAGRRLKREKFAAELLGDLDMPVDGWKDGRS